MIVIAGSAVGVAVIAGLVLLGGGKKTRKLLPPEPDPTTSANAQADLAERIRDYDAEKLFLDVQRLVTNETWLTAHYRMQHLRKEYSKSKYYVRNAAAIDALWSKIQEALRPKTPAPTTSAPPAPPNPPGPPPSPAPPAPK